MSGGDEVFRREVQSADEVAGEYTSLWSLRRTQVGRVRDTRPADFVQFVNVVTV